MKTLQIITTAYRASAEEQDDQILWLSRAMKSAGANLDVLLCSNAVNYAVAAQDASGLRIGDWRQSRPPGFTDDVAALLEEAVAVFVMGNDLEARGIGREHLVDGPQIIARADIAVLFERYDHIWRW